MTILTADPERCFLHRHTPSYPSTGRARRPLVPSLPERPAVGG
ncbi:MAG: hypothetical protein M3461_06000 [Pseudomonadota bacterium]|nr:hypothetical protein [Pseudomonadota bacterium]